MAVGGSALMLDAPPKNPHNGRNQMEHQISENSDSDGHNNKSGLSPDRINSNLRSLDHELILQKTPDSFPGEFGV